MLLLERIWDQFRGQCGKLTTYPSPKPTFCPKWEVPTPPLSYINTWAVSQKPKLIQNLFKLLYISESSLVMISFLLMICMFDQAVLLLGEIGCWSLGLTGLIGFWLFKHSMNMFEDNIQKPFFLFPGRGYCINNTWMHIGQWH